MATVTKRRQNDSRNFEKDNGDSNAPETPNKDEGNGHVFQLKSFRDNLQKLFDPAELEIFEFVLITRIVAVFAWTVSIFFATYQVYLACEEHLQWNVDPIMNPSSLSRLLNRGKDTTDFEWEMFMHVYITRLWFWYASYAVASRIFHTAYPMAWRFVSPGLSFIMFWELLGFLPTVFILFQPIIYWVLAQTRSRMLAWIVTILFIYNLNEPFVKTFIPQENFSEYFFVITTAWNYARCISFCYDVWEKVEKTNGRIGLIYLENSIRFCFYLPLAISGPLVTYNSFEKNIIHKDVEALKQRSLSIDFKALLVNLLRVCLVALLNDVLLHFLHFRALSLTTNVHRYLNIWAICGTVYLLGQFFSHKYKVLYGIPTCIAEFDGMEMPPLPRCPSYLHRYSVLWRDFDRGLYRFLVNYVYLPTLKFVKDVDKMNRVPSDVQKLFASFMTFAYVYIWHSLSFDVFLWALLNFVGITIERIGSAIKREIDKRSPVEPIVWDFFIEPFVTVPLAAMSILNSSVFCGSYDAAKSFTITLWDKRADNRIFVFLYFFTHTAVAYRTWFPKFKKLFFETNFKVT